MTETRNNKRTAERSIEKYIKHFPHLVNVRESISELKRYVELLEKRKVLAKTGSASATDYDKNEIKILACETNITISKVNKTIKERTDYFQDYHSKLVEIYPEVSDNFTSLVAQAKKLSQDKKFHAYKKLQKEINEAEPYIQEFKTNWEIKFRYYIELKAIVNSKPETKTSKLEKVEI